LERRDGEVDAGGQFLVELPDDVDPGVCEGGDAFYILLKEGEDALCEQGGDASWVWASRRVDLGEGGEELVEQAGEQEVLGRVVGGCEAGEGLGPGRRRQRAG